MEIDKLHSTLKLNKLGLIYLVKDVVQEDLMHA